MLLENKLDEQILVNLRAKLRPNANEIIKRYTQHIHLNRIQFNRFKPGAGRNYAVHPAGTGKGCARLPKVMIPGQGYVAKGRPSTKGGPRAYHDRTTKPVRKLNKKFRKLAVQQMFIRSILYSNFYYLKSVDETKLERKELLSLVGEKVGAKLGRRIKRAYRSHAKIGVLVHSSNELTRLYRNSQLDLLNVLQPHYATLELMANSNHLIIYVQHTLNHIIANL